MLSYLCNRHYQILTKEFPEELKVDQPKVVYLPAHNGERRAKDGEKKGNTKLKLKRSRQLNEYSSPVGDW